MKMKTFFASTMQDALKQVRESLGADAVIMSSKKTDQGIELVAALNYDEQALASQYMNGSEHQLSAADIARKEAEKLLTLEHEKAKTKSRIEERKLFSDRTTGDNAFSKQALIDELESKFTARSNHPPHTASQSSVEEVSSAARKPWPVEPTGKKPESRQNAVSHGESEAIKQMQSQILQLQDLLKQQIAQTEKKQSVVYQEIAQRLSRMGFDPSQTGWLLDGKEKERDVTQSWRQVVRQMSDKISVSQEELIDQPGCIAFLGATGAGKTTTIGKLATRFVLKYGADNIALVTTDRYRIAAHEQLRVFGRILNIPVSVVDESHSLNDVLNSLKDKRLVLIDTAGLNLNSEEWHSQISEFERCEYEVRHCLVVPSTTQQHILKSSYHAHRRIGIDGCIVTKLDEAVSLGEVIGFLWQVEFPVNYLTDGQRIPDDIHLAQTSMLVGKSLELARSHSISNENQVESLAVS